jgi:simple sugar transport system ATP-binding protein
MVQGQNERTLAEAMIGEPIGERAAAHPKPVGARPADPVIRIGDIPIYPGELVGIAAVEGQGQRELLRGLAPLPGVAFVPEDRTTEGLVPGMSVAENLVLGRDRDARWRTGPLLRWDRVREHAESVLTEYQVTAPGPAARAGHLSGGNQQKLLLARALESRPRVMVVENPLRGLDIRATEEIRSRLRATASGGIAVVVYSTDLDEVIDLADRVLVVRGGIPREAPPNADRQVIGRLLLGLTRDGA